MGYAGMPFNRSWESPSAPQNGQFTLNPLNPPIPANTESLVSDNTTFQVISFNGPNNTATFQALAALPQGTPLPCTGTTPSTAS